MIKVGIIGMSPGNAHPYSWSAIINGVYDGKEITKQGYPGVTAYLDANRDTLGLTGAVVSHVWTQDRKISESIAKTTNISVIADNLADMIGEVDAVILARDDPENHVSMSQPFIDAGIPVFIDKPLAITGNDLSYFAEEYAKGKLIMSCSSMRYSNECRTAKTEMKSLGKLELITATGKKDWVKYGVHMLEAVFALLDDPVPVSVKHLGNPHKDTVYIEFDNGIVLVMNIFLNISPTFQLSLFGENNWRLVEIKNSYSMFRDTIIEFIRSVQEGKPRLEFEKTENIIKTLIAGKESMEQGGREIKLGAKGK